MEDAHHHGPLCISRWGEGGQGPTITWGHTTGQLMAPHHPGTASDPTGTPSPGAEGQKQRGRVLTGLRRCGQREGREKRHLVRERQVSAPSPPTPIAPLQRWVGVLLHPAPAPQRRAPTWGTPRVGQGESSGWRDPRGLTQTLWNGWVSPFLGSEQPDAQSPPGKPSPWHTAAPEVIDHQWIFLPSHTF